MIPSHVPSVEESGLVRLEYDEVVANHVPNLADPSPAKDKEFPAANIQCTPQKVVQK